MRLLIIIRADASPLIGSGHIMRCLTLAKRIRKKGAVVSFVIRECSGNLYECIRSYGFEVHLLPECDDGKQELRKPEDVWIDTRWKSDAEQTLNVLKMYERRIDWLIVDHYGIDHHWQSLLRGRVRKIMVIDDLANRHHDCDVLLDQNYYHNAVDRYQGLVSKDCSLFLGPQYLLLRDEFYNVSKNVRARTGEVTNILVFYGGSDATNETEKCLTGLCDFISSKVEINVVTGQSNPKKDRIKNLCSVKPNMYFHCQVANLAELMNKADLAFGAGGSTMWERCFLGLPSIITVTAENQREITQGVSELGAIRNLGWYEAVTTDTIIKAAGRLLRNPSELLTMERKSFDVLGLRGSSGIELLIETIFQEDSQVVN